MTRLVNRQGNVNQVAGAGGGASVQAACLLKLEMLIHEIDHCAALGSCSIGP